MEKDEEGALATGCPSNPDSFCPQQDEGEMREMLQVPQIEDIRRLWEMGSNVKRIADDMHIDRKTVRKYLDMDDFNDGTRHVFGIDVPGLDSEGQGS
ncbi:MAG: hypothetical protein WCR76_04565 [Sphaerochaetaceae bacterium]